MKELWTEQKEVEFFTEARKFATHEQLFYLSNDKRYFAYQPKTYKGIKTTLQSRNSLIGRFTEKYSVDLLEDFALKHKWFAVQGVICEEIGLSSQSSADVAICKTKDIIQRVENILIIFEIKMSIVWNWELKQVGKKEELICLGDYKSHHGNPRLLRSDSMLKALEKVLTSEYLITLLPVFLLLYQVIHQ